MRSQDLGGQLTFAFFELMRPGNCCAMNRSSDEICDKSHHFVERKHCLYQHLSALAKDVPLAERPPLTVTPSCSKNKILSRIEPKNRQ